MIEIKKYNHSELLLSELSKIAFNYKCFKELGYPIFSDINHVWYLIYKNNYLIGFCSAIQTKNNIKFSHDYIIEKERGNKYYDLIFKERLNDYEDKKIISVATNKSVNTFLRYGFQIIKKTKKYNFLKK
jgi:hypothetical protein